jgi:hypothetical protein
MPECIADAIILSGAHHPLLRIVASQTSPTYFDFVTFSINSNMVAYVRDLCGCVANLGQFPACWHRTNGRNSDHAAVINGEQMT